MMRGSSIALAALCALALGAATPAMAQTYSITDMSKTQEMQAAQEQAVFLTAEECGTRLENSTGDLIAAFAPCLASQAASTECCQAVEDSFSFRNQDFGGCLCHGSVWSTIMTMADTFMPGASTLVPAALNNCTSDYGADFAFAAQTTANVASCGAEYDTEAQMEVGPGYPEEGAVTAQSRSDDASGAEQPAGEGEQDASQGADKALTVFAVLGVEECAFNLLGDKEVMISTMAPCILAKDANAACCSAIEQTFSYDNRDFGGCLCHQEVMQGIFEEAELFLPGATQQIMDAFYTCTDQHGSQFPFYNQTHGSVSCSASEELEPPSNIYSGEGANFRQSEGDEEESAAFGAAWAGAFVTTAAALAATVLA